MIPESFKTYPNKSLLSLSGHSLSYRYHKFLTHELSGLDVIMYIKTLILTNKKNIS